MDLQAIGLSNAPISATLNQAMHLEIPIISTDFEQSDLIVSLAGEKQHEIMNVNYPRWLPHLEFSVSQTADKAVLHVTSRAPIKEPVVNFVLMIKYREAVFYKEIIMLLDPAIISKKSEVSQLKPTNLTQVRSRIQPELTEKSLQQNDRLKDLDANNKNQIADSVDNAAIKPPTTIDNSSEKFVVVQLGQSLWKLAATWKVDNTTIFDRMDAIFLNNPHAFLKGDRDRLRLGARVSLKEAFLSVKAISNSANVDKQNSTNRNKQERVNIVNANRNIPKKSSIEPLTQERLSLNQQIEVLNQKIAEQRLVNEGLKSDMKRLERFIEKISLKNQVQLDNEGSEIVSRSDTPLAKAENTPENRATTILPFSPITQTIDDSNAQMNRYWDLGIRVAFVLLLVAFIVIVYSRKSGAKKERQFTKQLNKKFKQNLHSKETKQDKNKQLDNVQVPERISSRTQVNCLRSAVDFYCQSNRFDLAKELVNESLIQFSRNKKIVKALLRIRNELKSKLEESMQIDLVEKLNNGNFPQPGIILDAIHDEEELASFNDEFIRDWNNKVRSIK
ncbi:MAG: hypothetical protein KUG78_21025 [Kangiellaceae bacterium]|nr:hypothetical protein [Kangiellaceae bacterium]